MYILHSFIKVKNKKYSYTKHNSIQDAIKVEYKFRFYNALYYFEYIIILYEYNSTL